MVVGCCGRRAYTGVVVYSVPAGFTRESEERKPSIVRDIPSVITISYS